MKFLYADSLDFVDPRYDFLRDESPLDREAYWDDLYPHEILGFAPYDGLLVSRATVDGRNGTSKYPEGLKMRFRLVGARTFLRFNRPEFADRPIFGDCGAFSYVNEDVPPYTPEDMIDFYEDGDFTHGLSIDHIIFDFKADAVNFWDGINKEAPESDDRYRRFRLTLDLAEVFLSECRKQRVNFEPVGVIQGWSQHSMAYAAILLAKMGYKYLALGGMVPLGVPEIHTALRAVHAALVNYPDVRLHILGFAKADQLDEFAANKAYPKLTSVDTTSPLLRAFKDARRNYYLPTADGKIDYFTAIRIPQALENNHLKRAVKKGIYRPEDLLSLERIALDAIRAYANESLGLEQALDAITTYTRSFVVEGYSATPADEKKMSRLLQDYRRTLAARPWLRCNCPICKTTGVETLIFRGSNRNKRRGIHNLHVFYRHLEQLR